MPGENQSLEQVKSVMNPAEGAPQPEKATEQVMERSAEVAAPRPLQRVPVQVVAPAAPSTARPASASLKSETLRSIESVMEEDLAAVYKTMPPAVKQEFKKKGEETASQIEKMLYQVKVHSKKVFQLLFIWLRIIPGVNKFFLEQEAKLKTDEIMRLKETMDKQRGK